MSRWSRLSRRERLLLVCTAVIATTVGIDFAIRDHLLPLRSRAHEQLAVEQQLALRQAQLLASEAAIRDAAAGVDGSSDAPSIPTTSAAILTAIHNISAGRIETNTIDPLRAEQYTVAIDGTGAVLAIADVLVRLRAIGGVVDALTFNSDSRHPKSVRFRVQCRFEHVTS